MVPMTRLAISMSPFPWQDKATRRQDRFRRAALHDAPYAGHGEFGEKAGATAFFHFVGQLPHGLLRDGAAFTAGKGGSGVLERQKKFHPLPLAFFP
jgi:hypothetical protein